MDGLRDATGPMRPKIPDILIDATIRAIKAGMKPDELSRAVDAQQEQQAELAKTQGVKIIKKKERVWKARSHKIDDAEPDRTYRSLDERRLGILIVGDRNRFGAEENVHYIFAAAAPLDYSFSMISNVEEITADGEEPVTGRNYRQPTKTADERYETSSLRLSYNVIDTLDGLVNVLYKVLAGGPVGLCWLDISFNALVKLDEETLMQLPNLKILYLHGNCIIDMFEIRKLTELISLTHLTLHGNPIEEEEGYKIAILYYMPYLSHLDFTGVTKRDRDYANEFGKSYESYWGKRHEQLETAYANQKKAAAITYTQRVLEGNEDID